MHTYTTRGASSLLYIAFQTDPDRTWNDRRRRSLGTHPMTAARLSGNSGYLIKAIEGMCKPKIGPAFMDGLGRLFARTMCLLEEVDPMLPTIADSSLDRYPIWDAFQTFRLCYPRACCVDAQQQFPQVQ